MKILQHPDGTYEIEFLNNSIRIEESPAHYGIAGIYTRQTLVDGHNLTTAIKFTNKRDLDTLRIELNSLFGWDVPLVRASDFQKLAADLQVAEAGNKNSEKVIQMQQTEINALNGLRV